MSSVVFDHQIFSWQRYGGISRYYCELAARVHRAAGFDAKVVAPLHLNDYLPHCVVPQFACHLNVHFRGSYRLFVAANRLLAPPVIRALHPSILHQTYYEEPLRLSRSARVITIFDMIHELLPDHFSPKDPFRAKKRLCVEQVDHILCISESTASDLQRLLNVPRSKISVTHLGLSETFLAPAPSNEAPPHPSPYVLYVGQRGGYKNFELALRAYAQNKRLTEAFDFVTFGGHPWLAAERELIASLGLRPQAVRRVVGSDQDLARTYRHAHLFVYPSKYEGFGIPPLEAMSAGCVVACSDTSSIPEVVGDAGVYFDPNSQDSLASALERGCFDQDLRTALKAAGMRRVQVFSWDQCAAQTVAAYQKVLGRSPLR